MIEYNIGKVVGDSAFEVWQKLEGNKDKTEQDFFKSLQGKSAYQTWLDLGNTGDEQAFLDSLVPQYKSKFISKGANRENIYGWYDKNDREVGRYVAEAGERGEQGKAGLNWDGTMPEYPEVPQNVPYGTTVEFAGTTPPAGWVYTSGQNLPKGKYPFLVGIIPHVDVPEDSKDFINPSNFLDNRNSVVIDGITHWTCSSINKFFEIFKRRTLPSGNNNVDRKLSFMFDSDNTSYCKMINEGVGTPEVYQDYIEVKLTEQRYLQRLEYKKNTNPVAIDIQVKSGDLWSTIEEADFTNDSTPTTHNPDLRQYICKNKILTSHFRLALKKTVATSNWLRCGIYCGELPLVNKEIIQIPYEKDADGKFKIIFVGEPIAD